MLTATPQTQPYHPGQRIQYCINHHWYDVLGMIRNGDGTYSVSYMSYGCFRIAHDVPASDLRGITPAPEVPPVSDPFIANWANSDIERERVGGNRIVAACVLVMIVIVIVLAVWTVKMAMHLGGK